MTVRATRVRRLRIRKAIRRATFAVTVLTASTLFLAIEKNVTLIVDGHHEALSTTAGSIEELLGSEGLALEPGFEVQPPLQTPVVDGMTITVDLDAAGAQLAGESVWVVDGTSDASPRAAAFAGAAEGVVGPSRILPVTVVVRGKDRDVLTNAETVWELLSAMGIRPDDDDRVSPPPSTLLSAGATVRFSKVEILRRRVRRPIEFGLDVEYTEDLPPGVVRTVREGRHGVLIRTYRVRIVDGHVVRRALVDKSVAREPVDERRLVGRHSAEVKHGSQTGEASWYYAPSDGMTAAHPWLPFGTVVKVTNLETGESVSVVINDRGPFGGRIIDLNEEAFAQIAHLGQGVAQVRLDW